MNVLPLGASFLRAATPRADSYFLGRLRKRMQTLDATANSSEPKTNLTKTKRLHYCCGSVHLEYSRSAVVPIGEAQVDGFSGPRVGDGFAYGELLRQVACVQIAPQRKRDDGSHHWTRNAIWRLALNALDGVCTDYDPNPR